MVTVKSIFVTVDKALNDEIVTNGGIKFYIDPSYNPEWNVSVTGMVAATPKHNKFGVEVGDEVAFDYSVISEMRFSENPALFAETIEGVDYYKRWENQLGQMISVFGYDGVISKRWGCSLFDKKKGIVIDGKDNASESEKDRWLSQFSFGGVHDFRFKNLLEINNNDYWNVTASNILAVKKGDQVVSKSNYVICRQIVKDVTSTYNIQNGVSYPPMSVCFELTDRVLVDSDYPALGLKKGDIASTEEKYLCRYELWGEKYLLVNKNRILGTWHK